MSAVTEVAGRIIYVDECGYTGQNLLNPKQPIMVISSISLQDEIAASIKDSCFSKIQAKELKYSKLRKSPAGREAILNLIRSLRAGTDELDRPIATAFHVHKKFNLTTLMVDWWIEPAMYEDGIDLYKQKANLALANGTYAILESLVPKEFADLLHRFEKMMRERSETSYQRFWSFAWEMYDRANETAQKMLKFFLIGEARLGLAILNACQTTFWMLACPPMPVRS